MLLLSSLLSRNNAFESFQPWSRGIVAAIRGNASTIHQKAPKVLSHVRVLLVRVLTNELVAKPAKCHHRSNTRIGSEIRDLVVQFRPTLIHVRKSGPSRARASAPLNRSCARCYDKRHSRIARSERRRNHVATFDPLVDNGAHRHKHNRGNSGASAFREASSTAALPDGMGKELVQRACTTCHGVNQISNSTGYTKERWQALFGNMIKLPDPQADTVAQYLATHFPHKPGREPKLVPGPVQISFREWQVPTLGQRSRDPVQSPDGMIWWAGHWATSSAV